MKLLAIFLLLAAAAPVPEMRYFRYQRPVQLPADFSGQACLVLDPQLFAHASRDLADVRLYRDGIENPYAIQQALPEQKFEQEIPALNLGKRNGRTVFDAVMPDGIYSDLQLSVTGRDFLATVTVSGSHDNLGTHTQIGSFTIFDLTRQKLGRSTVLHLPNSTFRFLHFEIAGPLAPAAITGLSVVRLPESQPRYVTVSESTQIVHKGHASIAELTIPAHVPVDRVLITPPAQPINFSRDVTVSATALPPQSFAAGDLPPPPSKSYGNLLRLRRIQDGHRIDEEHLAIDAPQVVFDSPAQWTVTIENGDDLPLAIGVIHLQMVERDLCFDAVAPSHYLLFYGDPAIRAPQYDYAALFTPHTGPAVASLAPERPNPAWQPRPDTRPFTERHPALLWIALIIVVLLLAAIALRSATRVETPAKMP